MPSKQDLLQAPGTPSGRIMTGSNSKPRPRMEGGTSTSQSAANSSSIGKMFLRPPRSSDSLTLLWPMLSTLSNEPIELLRESASDSSSSWHSPTLLLLDGVSQAGLLTSPLAVTTPKSLDRADESHACMEPELRMVKLSKPKVPCKTMLKGLATNLFSTGLCGQRRLCQKPSQTTSPSDLNITSLNSDPAGKAGICSFHLG
mmetsp:Transcript_41396/g.74980  ORF Transcript_41396/g.74980 Transcript_41396/m.74980 type:complete len:201 (-) Transcript_41396:226-828(-)